VIIDIDSPAVRSTPAELPRIRESRHACGTGDEPQDRACSYSACPLFLVLFLVLFLFAISDG
jgi:hypothetical protein